MTMSSFLPLAYGRSWLLDVCGRQSSLRGGADIHRTGVSGWYEDGWIVAMDGNPSVFHQEIECPPNIGERGIEIDSG